MKRYILKHKNVPVAELELDTESGAIAAIKEVYRPEHIPVGIPVKKGQVSRKELNDWWNGRAIPASRLGLREALAEFKMSNTQLLLEKCLGLSLSDQYWICPIDTGLKWEQINFFENDFSEDVGNILFGKGGRADGISLMSPDNTSDGWLKKKWTIINGRRCLVKGGSGATQQEPYNEVIASSIMERLHIPHVPYRLLMEEQYPYSVCEDFITPDTELISAWHIMQTKKKPNHITVYRHYVDCCKELGISGVEDALDQMLVLDYLIANEDRHLNNFGVIRHAETLEYLGAAPIFDSGTSLWFDKPVPLINPNVDAPSKPFKTSHEEQIKLVSDFSWVDFPALSGIDEEFRELVKGSVFIDSARCERICKGLIRRVERLKDIAAKQNKQIVIDNIKNDVERDIAYSGTDVK